LLPASKKTSSQILAAAVTVVVQYLSGFQPVILSAMALESISDEYSRENFSKAAYVFFNRFMVSGIASLSHHLSPQLLYEPWAAFMNAISGKARISPWDTTAPKGGLAEMFDPKLLVKAYRKAFNYLVKLHLFLQFILFPLLKQKLPKPFYALKRIMYAAGWVAACGMVTDAAGRFNGASATAGLIVRHLTGAFTSFAQLLDIQDSMSRSLHSCTIANCWIWMVRLCSLALVGAAPGSVPKSGAGPLWLQGRLRFDPITWLGLLYPACQVAGLIRTTRLTSEMQKVLFPEMAGQPSTRS
jgi:hypothetical protein